jgi:hypothetical protein
LTNPRYHTPEITLYGYAPQVVYEKIHSVDGRNPQIENMLHHVLSNPNVPGTLFSLVVEAKKEQAKGQKKTVESCYQQLQRLQSRMKNYEPFQLRSELIALFKSHGLVNFAERSVSVTINGYDISTLIGDFYNIPNRTTIDLPDDIVANIRELLKDLIDQERARQMKKL